jgi:hypothetical protein
MILNVYAKVLKTSVHEKNMGKNFQTKKSIIAKMIVQCKQKSLPCSVALVNLR